VFATMMLVAAMTGGQDLLAMFQFAITVAPLTELVLHQTNANAHPILLLVTGMVHCVTNAKKDGKEILAH